MDGSKNTDSAIDQLEFGLTFNISDAFSVAFAHTNTKDVMGDMYYYETLTGDKLVVSKTTIPISGAGCLDDDDATACNPTAVEKFTLVTEDGGDSTAWYFEEDEVESATKVTVGSKENHFGAQVSFGSLSAYVTHSQDEKNGASEKSKVTRYRIHGPLGDNNLRFYLMARSEDPAGAGEKTTPWLAGLNKGLGDGAADAFIEYHDEDVEGKSGKATIGLAVHF